MTVCGLELSPCPRVCVICGWWEEFRHARQSRSTHQLEQYAQATDRASECQAINNCARSCEGERSFLYSVKPSQMRWCCSVPYEGAVLHKGPYEALVRRKAAVCASKDFVGGNDVVWDEGVLGPIFSCFVVCAGVFFVATGGKVLW